ncbi:MAG: nucleotidyltransferase domain-containing protein [bacterium]|nr:nucleotidyltransferase domain-containing protein [bacterium]
MRASAWVSSGWCSSQPGWPISATSFRSRVSQATRSSEVSLTPEQETLLARVTDGLARVEGVAAVALGGSHAAGTARPDSDLDLGVYYREARPLDVAGLRAFANELDPKGASSVTEPGGWGPWMDGGAWLRVDGERVDWIYRDLDRLSREIDAAERGDHQWHAGQQPTHGFFSVTLLAELDVCQPLRDREGILAALKARVATYPPALRRRLQLDYLGLAEFTLYHARKHAARGDVYNTVGCLTRAAGCLTQVLHAAEERYFLSDKAALAVFTASDRELLDEILGAPGRSAGELGASVDRLAALFEHVRSRVPEYASKRLP